MATTVYETEIGVGVRWLTRVRFAPSDFQIKIRLSVHLLFISLRDYIRDCMRDAVVVSAKMFSELLSPLFLVHVSVL